MFYIFNKHGSLLGRSDYEPDSEDLKTRNEYCIENNQDLIFNRVIGGKYGGIYETVETPEEQSQYQNNKILSERNNTLNRTDWIITRHLEEKMAGLEPTLSEEQIVVFLSYRQQLRDITNIESFPFIYLPETPKFLE